MSAKRLSSRLADGRKNGMSFWMTLMLWSVSKSVVKLILKDEVSAENDQKGWKTEATNLVASAVRLLAVIDGSYRSGRRCDRTRWRVASA